MYFSSGPPPKRSYLLRAHIGFYEYLISAREEKIPGDLLLDWDLKVAPPSMGSVFGKRNNFPPDYGSDPTGMGRERAIPGHLHRKSGGTVRICTTTTRVLGVGLRGGVDRRNE
jgi:hypothetical protein